MHEKLLLDAMHSFIQALKFVALQHALQLVLSSHSQVTQSPTVTTAYFPGAHQIRTRLQNIECSHTKVIMVEHCTQCHISLQWVNKTSTDESTRCENEVRLDSFILDWYSFIQDWDSCIQDWNSFILDWDSCIQLYPGLGQCSW